MKKLTLGSAMVLGVVLLACVLTAAEPAAQPGVADFAWLAGRWQFEQDGRVVSEEWMAPAGGTMLGMSRTVKAGRTVEYEFIVLRADESGTLQYIASPSGQTPTTFKLISLGDGSAVFENKANDFPQRIIYTRKPDGSLLASIEGERNGKVRRVDYPYRRVE
jgi:hypothetical protein